MNQNSNETALAIDLGKERCRCKELEHKLRNDECAFRLMEERIKDLEEQVSVMIAHIDVVAEKWNLS